MIVHLKIKSNIFFLKEKYSRPIVKEKILTSYTIYSRDLKIVFEFNGTCRLTSNSFYMNKRDILYDVYYIAGIIP